MMSREVAAHLATTRWSELARRLAVATVMAAAVAICGPEATAQRNQGPQNALQGFSQNRDQPIRIRAASLEVREKDKHATFTGGVHVVNGDTELRSTSLVVLYDEETGSKNVKAADPGPGGERSIKRIEAKGGVIVTQKDQTATGNVVIFNMRENVVVLTGDVVVARAGSVMRGQRLTVDLTSGISRMDQGPVDVLIPARSGEAPKGGAPKP